MASKFSSKLSKQAVSAPSGQASRHAQLTVSAKVSALEKRLGTMLLQRTTRKLRATPAGETLLQQCVQALERLQAAENELTSAQSEPQGILRVTAPADIGHTLFLLLWCAVFYSSTRGPKSSSWSRTACTDLM